MMQKHSKWELITGRTPCVTNYVQTVKTYKEIKPINKLFTKNVPLSHNTLQQSKPKNHNSIPEREYFKIFLIIIQYNDFLNLQQQKNLNLQTEYFNNPKTKKKTQIEVFFNILINH
jgi:hypothetical protein